MMEIRKRPSYVYLNIHLSLPVCIGSEKPQWGVPITYTYILILKKELIFGQDKLKVANNVFVFR